MIHESPPLEERQHGGDSAVAGLGDKEGQAGGGGRGQCQEGDDPGQDSARQVKDH